ncbi:nucleotide exchange factor GrpE [Paenibacillus shunpengii]|uniref:Protein GrpE n=1 Tax=Paenibacillus shunpengii TaxID=2054424 RepID=A0ABW5SSV3_9BACL|nr:MULTISPECIES: nucleotide exchange factor GrpE [unclassified Paenibacillus]OMC69035.1 nucleotide exchange factor GrpE [Paenibacillus sp. FSL H7-0326]SDX06930.1 molecular chaperone GrpE [Paenibacillus sp. PDC88]
MKDEQTIENTEENTPQEDMVNEAAQAESTEAQEAAVNDTETAGAETLASTEELDRLKALAEENEKRYLRAQADFDNFRRRTQKEKEDLAKYASMKLITELVPVIDNFERAIATAPANTESDSFAKGVGMIFRQLESVLQAEGLTAMQTVGEAFNPEFHQAIMQVESEEHEEGIVVEEVQKGYMLKDKVLRPAMVKVSM